MPPCSFQSSCACSRVPDQAAPILLRGKLLCGRIVFGSRKANVAGGICCVVVFVVAVERRRWGAAAAAAGIVSGGLLVSPSEAGPRLLTASGLSSDAPPSITHLYRTVARVCRESQVSFCTFCALTHSLIPTSPRRPVYPLPSTTRLLHLSSQAV